MKLALITLIAIAAVAIGASVDDRRRRDSGADVDAVGSSAKGMGDYVAAETGMVEGEGQLATGARVSADSGYVEAKSVKGSLKVRKSGDEKNAAAQ